jgi:hypothetical protein
VTYGSGTADGRQAFGVNWIDVGYFSSRTDKLNQFQLVLIDRSDTGAGNFDIEFNYGNILWETGEASGGIKRARRQLGPAPGSRTGPAPRAASSSWPARR